MSQSPPKRITHLREELNRANHLYYVESRPTLSDREYDKLLQELIDLEKQHPDLITPDSPTQRVVEEPIAALKPVKKSRQPATNPTPIRATSPPARSSASTRALSPSAACAFSPTARVRSNPPSPILTGAGSNTSKPGASPSPLKPKK